MVLGLFLVIIGEVCSQIHEAQRRLACVPSVPDQDQLHNDKGRTARCCSLLIHPLAQTAQSRPLQRFCGHAAC